jgi:PKD repeat protein
MNKLIIVTLFIFSLTVTAAPPECSKNGTTIIYTNGVTTTSDAALSAIKEIKKLNLNSKFDKNIVNYELAYNQEESMRKDFLESAVQRFPQTFLKSLNVTNAYAAYENYLQGGLNKPEFEASLKAITADLIQKVQINLADYENYPQFFSTLNKIKGHYEAAFARKERVYAISHSQGGLFMNDVYNLLAESDYKKKIFSGFQVASPLLSEMNSKFGYATHDKDRLINAIRLIVGALPANVDAPLILPNEYISNGITGLVDYAIEFVVNHGIETTYLYNQTIKDQIIAKMITAGQLIESNCNKAVMEVTKKDKLKISFDSTDPDDLNVTDLHYFWDFGDTKKAETTSKTIDHKFSKSGTYQIKLKVLNNDGDFDEKSIEVKVVGDGPKAVIKSTVNNLTVNFDSTDPDDPNITGLTYLWDFGDKKSAKTTSKTISHTYVAEGNYTISLTVKDSSGATDSTSKLILVQSNVVTFCNSSHTETTFTFTIDGLTTFSLHNTELETPGYNSAGEYEYIDCECKMLALQPQTTYHVKVTSTDIIGLYGNADGSYNNYPILPFNEDIFINQSNEPFSYRYNNDGTPSLPYGTFSVIRGGTNYCRSIIYK